MHKNVWRPGRLGEHTARLTVAPSWIQGAALRQGRRTGR